MAHHPKNRPRTLLLGKDASTRPALASAGAGGASRRSAELDIRGTSKPTPPTNDSRKALPTLNCCEQDPWDVYVPRARIRRGQRITLGQHRQHKREIVNIQCLSVDRSQIKGLLETISQLSDPIFPRLLESYYDMNQLYLVWEPIDITVDNILTAPWPVNETELACVLCSTLDGIRFLRDQGRALATLGPDTVWLRKRGQGYSIQMSGMNADTLKSTARATVMRSLMATGAGHGRWSSEAQTFLEICPSSHWIC
ncbi:hypothetical protein CBS13152_11292 [Aspergillus niger]|nr:hypothetical protein CBS13152_11292 [Aspergillus niger]